MVVKINVKRELVRQSNYDINPYVLNSLNQMLDENFDTFCINFERQNLIIERDNLTGNLVYIFNLKEIPIIENIELVQQIEERIKIGL